MFIVHCVDTEGPLNESLAATFERLESIYSIKMQPTRENLLALQEKKIDLGGLEQDVAHTFSKHLLNYNNSWEKIDAMLSKIMSSDYRLKYPDSNGRGIVYNWHCLDNVGFETNERSRDLGFGNVFTHFVNKNKEFGCQDEIHWHFHPLSFNREAHICSTNYDYSYPLLHEIISRRLIDHSWFPVVNRAGFHAIRQDSSFFLEQWIPFDYSNQATYKNSNSQLDYHRYGDWRRAPKEWIPYHPSHDDYQTVGHMNRLTTKCLNIGTRYKLLDDNELEMAFRNSMEYGNAILAFTNHDCRDMSVDIDDIYSRIHQISKKFPDVKLHNSHAVEAIQKSLFDQNEIESNKLVLRTELVKTKKDCRLIVEATNGQVFGSQPYLSIKTKDGRYYHDNFNENKQHKSWQYIMDRESVDYSEISSVAVGANDKYGNQAIHNLDKE